MYRISKEFSFSASHQLSHLPQSHPCARLHGHNYVVEVELSGQSLDENGFILDYNELDAFKQHLDEVYDHRHLNDVMGSSFTTAENLAKRLFDWCKERWPQVSAVTVNETPKTRAEYRP